MSLDPINVEEESRASMREWIVKTFKRRECIQYKECGTTKEKCGCGKRLYAHKDVSVVDDDPTKPWKIQNHTKLYPTNAFGTLEFQASDALALKAEYIRFSFDTKPQHIIKLLKSYWQLELPNLIISVHGGIANFTLQPKLKQAIGRGLHKVANTSKIWIITSGADTGVVKHLGDMISNDFPQIRNNIIAIGILPWGVINGNDSLIGCGIETTYYPNSTIQVSSCVNLNNCHSYFLFVDDGTVGKYGCEISFRRRLERFLSRHKSEIFRPRFMDINVEERIVLQNHHAIPLVCLVIEGGTNTIQTVLVNVRDKPPVPVVICDGSGRAADLLAFTHKYVLQVNNKITMELEIKEQLINTIKKTFGYNKQQAEHLFIELMHCVANKDLISIYRLGEDNLEIDVAILTASLKVVDIQLNKQLDLIMSWNRPDIAKNYIFLTGNNAEKNILASKMFDALAQDKVEFVKLLLEYGVNLQTFLTYKSLQDLYNCKKGPSSTLQPIIKDVVKKKLKSEISLLDIGLVMEKLIGNGYISEYSKRDFKFKYARFLEKTYNPTAHQTLGQETYLFKFPYNELLIWAVLMKRHKMAMFVCSRGEETLAKALVAYKLNKALAKEAESDDLDGEICDEYKRYAEEFGSLAYGLLDTCYKEDDKLTNQLLTYDLINWSHWTCLSLAFSGNFKDFLAHTSCQALISDLWMGGMKMRKYITFKVINALLFPPALFGIQFKTAKELQYMPQTQEEHEHDLGELTSISSSSSNNSEASYSRDELDNSVLRHDNRQLSNGSPLNIEQIIDLYDTRDISKISEHAMPLTSRRSTQIDSEHIKQLQLHHQHHAHNHHEVDKDVVMRTIQEEEEDRNVVTFFEPKRKTNKIRIGKRIYEFYNAPITKYWQNFIFYMLFLLCLTYIVLVKTPITPSPWEWIVLIYIFTFALDKIREFIQGDSPRFSGKFKVFFSKIMNIADCICILTICVALPLRLTRIHSYIIIARLIYCINSIYWYIKLLEFLLINKYMGPLIMIASRMLVDLFNFVVILLIVMISFGLSRQAIKYPHRDFTWDSVKHVFLEPYFMLYGEVYADKIDPECNLTANAIEPQPECQAGHWLTPLTMTAFLIVANLLLLTILIASFNTTFLRISKKSSQVWKMQRYHLVTTYEGKPLFAPPLVIFSHIYMIIKYIIRLCQRKKLKFDRKLKAFLTDEMIEALHEFEENCFYEYSHNLRITESNKMEEKVNHTTNRVENISSRIDDIFIKENMTKLSLYKVELRLQQLEDCTYELLDSFRSFSKQLTRRQSNSFNEDESKLVNTAVKTRTSTNSLLMQLNEDGSVHKNTPIRLRTKSSSLRRRMFSESHTQHYDINSAHLSNTNEVRKNSSQNLNKVKQAEQTSDEALIQLKEDKTKLNNNNSLNKEEKSERKTAFELGDEDELVNINKNAEKQPHIPTILTSVDSYNESTYKNDKDFDLNNSIMENTNGFSKLQSTVINDLEHLEHYTLHPNVYLHPVIKLPVTEYTSITDYIDTSDFDRSISPNINQQIPSSLNYTGLIPKFQTTNVNDYCTTESVRTTIARQESEMLKLAEESQHVIISQMLNKMVKQASIKNMSPSAVSTTTKSPIIRSNDNDNVFIFEKREADQSTSAAEISKAEFEEQDENEEDEEAFEEIEESIDPSESHLSESNRNKSQIWFVKSEADVLCLDLDEDEA